MGSVIFGLAIGSEHSRGPLFPTEAEADRERQATANSQKVEVTVLRFEVASDSGVGEFTDIKELRVLRAQP
jgi:hypothetical protein